ncbi:hypothetical protein GCM10025876_00530 [Demequina litorisediminis]|uniref:TGS domain-containing protein n=1 Tax=Demequina litorisediminis TaxID=1849022 RepID=A0ABQ6I7Q1_9MICO|nr:hypothetical protein GCM10025876_00530 [Demequina litorisediminis]
MPVESARRKAQETLEIYAPLAHRMGLNAIKWELEDLSFKTLYPKIYGEIVDVVAERAPEREKYLTEIRTEIAAELRQMKIKGEITGRPKHYYSVYQKMIVRGRDLADIYDLVGVRILVETVRDCYAVLGAMHARYQPVPGRFKDYIAMPKFNLYQSLHTTVIGPSGKPVELQIRTQEMHRRAEYGLASHWRYKETVKGAGGGKSDDMGWLRQIADWQQETADPTEFLDSLRGEISRAEVYVFTPRGRLLALPQGATPIDFAYAVHTEVGHKTIGAKVNGRLVPLDSTLENGDTVEVLTTSDQNAHPKRDWLDFAQSTRARNKIRQWFTRERREESIETGRDMLARAIRRQHLPMQRLMSKSTLLALAKEMHYEDVDGLYAAIGEHKEQASDVVSRMVEAVGGDEGADEDVTEITRPGTSAQRARRGDVGVSVHGLSDVVVKAREVLYAGARRPHPWVRDPRQWRLGASRGLRESRLPRYAGRTLHRRPVDRSVGCDLPGADRGGGARPQPSPVRRGEGALGLSREHPGRERLDQPRPRRAQHLYVRDGRPVPPRCGAFRHSPHRRRLRRPPHYRGEAAAVTRRAAPWASRTAAHADHARRHELSCAAMASSAPSASAAATRPLLRSA